MRFPKTTSLGIRTPSLPHLSLVSISSVAGTACTVAFWVLTVGAVLIPSAVLAFAGDGCAQGLDFRFHASTSCCSHSCNSAPMVPGISSPASSCQP